MSHGGWKTSEEIMKQWLRISEVQEMVGVSNKTLRRWAEEGVLPAVRMPGSRHRRWDTDQVTHFVLKLKDQLKGKEDHFGG
jgi:excisionase family DNA binding protein